MPAWHNVFCSLSKDFSKGSDTDAATALEKVLGAQLKLSWQ